MGGSDNRNASSLEKLGRLYDLSRGKIWASQKGEGKRAAIVLTGAGTVALDYYGIQQLLSKEYTVLLYDRLGIGLSASCNLPRSSRSVIEELHELLKVANVPRPCVLIGHSLGGLYARHYAMVYPENVCGLILLDPAHEDYDLFMPDDLNKLRKTPSGEAKKKLIERKWPDSPGMLVRISRNAIGRAILENVPMVARYRKIYAELFSDEMKDWPQEIAESLVKAHTDVQWLLGGSREVLNVYAIYEEVRKTGEVANITTTILCSMRTDGFKRVVLSGESEDQLAAEISGKKKLYEAYLSKIENGKLIEVDSGHVNMPFRCAEIVLQAAKEMAN